MINIRELKLAKFQRTASFLDKSLPCLTFFKVHQDTPNIDSSIMSLSSETMEALRKQCPELQQLPLGWSFKVEPNYRIAYIAPGALDGTTFDHPTFGGLPKPWWLKVVLSNDGKRRAMYYNPKTQKRSHENPRHMDSHLARSGKNVPRSLWIAAGTIKNNKSFDPSNFKRTPINYRHSIREGYFKVHAIDPGDGSIVSFRKDSASNHILTLSHRVV